MLGLGSKVCWSVVMGSELTERGFAIILWEL